MHECLKSVRLFSQVPVGLYAIEWSTGRRALNWPWIIEWKALNFLKFCHRNPLIRFWWCNGWRYVMITAAVAEGCVLWMVLVFCMVMWCNGFCGFGITSEILSIWLVCRVCLLFEFFCIGTALEHCCADAPCRLRGCKNGPAPFPGRMLYKATKPGLVCLSYLNMFYCIVVY